MKDGKFGLRAFGLAIVAALGLMAFSAVAAQAENLTDGGKAAEYSILGNPALVGKGQPISAALEKAEDGLAHGLLLVEKSNLTILCSGLQLVGGLFESSVEALSEVKFTGCVAFNFAQSEKLTTCGIVSKAEGGEKEVIVASVKVLPRKHEGESYLLIEPDIGTTLATIFFEKEKGCPLILSNQIKGTLGALVKEKENTPELLTFNSLIQTLLGDKLTFGANPAIVDGNTVVVLSTEHLGCKFGVI
jgi:hypothetical protein